ncbi:MAG TPA: antitoxin Xre-like helix-turn-helix domain-containing protein [Geminicoccaceae bacterium]|nr:antitoxin Xre-like helix-turn-helix domain-containing protein [Geminicoccaceae bacterium]
MRAELAYPATRYDPAPVVDLSARDERARLSRSALRAFFNIMQRWSIRDADARALLGGIASSTFYDYKRQPDRVLDQDRLTRISYLVGIFKALHILHGEELADRWVALPNRNRIFAGRSPLAYMLQGGAPAMQSVRRLLDARRGGA